MKAILFTIFSVLSLISVSRETKAEFVHGYMRGGTYVSPHFRSAPDSTTTDNFGSNQYAEPMPSYRMNSYPSMITPVPFPHRRPATIQDPAAIPLPGDDGE